MRKLERDRRAAQVTIRTSFPRIRGPRREAARENKIPVQYGVTGEERRPVFTRYGSVDVALGWPLRYSHSPGEVIDTKDAMPSEIVKSSTRSW